MSFVGVALPPLHTPNYVHGGVSTQMTSGDREVNPEPNLFYPRSEEN